MLVIRVVGFNLASALSGAAVDVEVLMAALALLSTTFTEAEERAEAFAISGATVGAALHLREDRRLDRHRPAQLVRRHRRDEVTPPVGH